VNPLARSGNSYAPFIAKPKAACVLCFHQLGGHVELPSLMRNDDVIHKPEVHNVSRRGHAEQDRATAMVTCTKRW